MSEELMTKIGAGICEVFRESQALEAKEAKL